MTVDYATQLWLFFALVFGIVVLPGMDMAFVLGSALAGGRRSGLYAVAGLVAAGACHVAVGALGITALLALVAAMETSTLAMGRRRDMRDSFRGRPLQPGTNSGQ